MRRYGGGGGDSAAATRVRRAAHSAEADSWPKMTVFRRLVKHDGDGNIAGSIVGDGASGAARDENTSVQIGHPLDGSLCLPLRFGRISPKRLHPLPDRHGCDARRSMLHEVDKDGPGQQRSHVTSRCLGLFGCC